MPHPHIIRRETAGLAPLPSKPSAFPTGSWHGAPPIQRTSSQSEQRSITSTTRFTAPHAASRTEPALPASTIVEVIVFVFARSELRALVGTDALRMALHGTLRALFPEPGTLALQPIWELLESQPGFPPAQSLPPMCQLKILEDRLRLTVVMPEALDVLDDEIRQHKAAQCQITHDELELLLRPPAIPTARVVATSGFEEPTRAKQSRLGLAMFAAICGLAVAATSAQLTLGGDDDEAMEYESVAANDVSTDIPLLEVRKSGSSVMATLSDPAWAHQPEAARELQLLAAAENVRMLGATSLVVVGVDGLLVGSVITGGTPTVTLSSMPAP